MTLPPLPTLHKPAQTADRVGTEPFALAQIASRSRVTIREALILVVCAAATAAFVAYLALSRSVSVGRLSIPPWYDDVVYLGDAQIFLHAIPHQSLLFNVYSLLDQHSPLTTLMGALGYLLPVKGDLGPYLISSGLIAALLLNCAWILRRSPLFLSVGLLCLIGCVPVVRLCATEFRPEFAWGVLLSALLTALFSTDFVTATPLQAFSTGLLAGITIISKPTTAPYTVILITSAIWASLLAQIIETKMVRGHIEAMSIMRCLAAVSIGGALVVIPETAIIGADILSYIKQVMFQISDQVSTSGGFWFQIGYYSIGAGGEMMLGPAFILCFGIWIVALTCLILFRCHSAPRMIAVFVVVVIAYAVPTLTRIKLVFFGVAFDDLLLTSTVLVVAASLGEMLARSPLPMWIYRASGTAVMAIGLFVLVQTEMIKRPPGLMEETPLQRRDANNASTQILGVLEAYSQSLANQGKLPEDVLVVAPEPITAGLVTLAGAKANLPLRGIGGYYARSAEELLRMASKAKFTVVGGSFDYPLFGPRFGSALITMLDQTPGFKLIGSYNSLTRDGLVRIYVHD